MLTMRDSWPGDLRPDVLVAFYTRHLREVLLPFWLNRSIDEEYGGFFTCFDNDGRRMLSTDKFTWSQGRMVWLWAKLAGMSLFSPAERQRFLALAQSGAEFLMKHCLLPNGNCTFLMTRDGAAKQQAPGMPLDSSVYADCFVVLGLARYAATSGERSALDLALRLYRSVTRRVESGSYNSEPYPLPAGYKPHGIPMILLNTAQELAVGLDALAAPEAGAVKMAADERLRQVMAFADANGALHEYVTSNGQLDSVTLLGRHVNPGHTIEDMWFVMDQARLSGDTASAETTIAWAAAAIKRAFEIGWDGDFGGLLHFADQDGGQPHGSMAGMENIKVAQQAAHDWGNKLWWVHSEALYSTLLAFSLTGDEKLLDLYRQVSSYTFTTFPNPDAEIGEWIQIRDRQGKPEQKIVALPVKDPFHIIRNVALIIELLQQQGG
jgi:N-acylglucosamine 2-epimerase